MSQSNQLRHDDGANSDEAREQMKTISGVESRDLDAGGADHDLAGMESKREAPIETVAENVVKRYDRRKAALREYVSNAHTACIQRAKLLCIDTDAPVDLSNVRAVLDYAESECGYDPVITVKRNKNDEARWSLKIEDNGIGIDATTAYALRDIGLSGWHMDGSTNGQFGQGTMSGFLLSGIYGEFHMATNSATTDDNYRAAWKLTDINRLKGERETVGTTFTWPVLHEEAKDIDFRDATREYAAGMLVPIKYEEYGPDGSATGRSDEFLPTHMADKYPDDALVISYEDEFGRAVWSPEDPEGWNTSLDTFCGYQPIDRNGSGWSINSHEMPSGFDFRLKVEDGSIIEVDGSMDHELVGKTPVSKQKYNNLLLKERDCIPESRVSDTEYGYVAPDEWATEYVTEDVTVASRYDHIAHTTSPDRLDPVVISGKYKDRRIVTDDEWAGMDEGRVGEQFVPRSEIDSGLDVLEAMQPTDDRDRFESKHVDAVMQRYSEQLWDELRDLTADVFESVDTFDDIFGLDGNEHALFHNGISRFGPKYSRSSADTVKQTLKDELGVDLAESVCRKVSIMKDTVSWAPRSASYPQRKSGRQTKPIWKVIRKATDGDSDGDVYMGHRISKRKAKLVWELDEDNQVVQTTHRSKYADKLGWNDMAELPTSDFDDEFDHDFSDAFLDSWDRSRSSSSSRSSGSSLPDGVTSLPVGDERAKQRPVDVRAGTGADNIRSVTGSKLFEALADDGDESVTHGRYDVERLVLYRDTECGKSVGQHLVDKSNGTFYAVVPNYVYDYLIQAEHVYSEDSYMDSLTDTWIDFDWERDDRDGCTIGSADERDVLLLADESDVSVFEEYNEMGAFRSRLESELQSYGELSDDQSIRSITYCSDLEDYYEVLCSRGNYDIGVDESIPSVVELTNGVSPVWTSHVSVSLEEAVYDIILDDLDRDAVEWAYFDVDPDDLDSIRSMKRLALAGGFVSTDDDSSIDIDLDGVAMSERDLWVAQTLNRLEAAGGFVGSDA